MTTLFRPLVIASLLAASAACAQTETGTNVVAPRILQGMEPDATESNLRETPIVRAVRRSNDAVISIYITRGDETLERGVDGQGSGVILDTDGLAITNWHVIANAAGRRVVALLNNGKSYRADVLSSSPENDLALLQLRTEDKLAAIETGDSDSLMVGETVIAIGNPQGHTNSVTAGVLSSTGRSITVRAPDGRVREYMGLLQTDAAINRGNSGGALLDINGRLIGINNAMAVGVENIGYAIPVNTVRRVFEEVLVSSENLANVWFGMRVQDAGDGDGAVVASVAPSGPAVRAGLEVGDLIVSAGGRSVDDALGYARATVRAQSGQAFSLKVRRDGADRDVAVQPMSKVAWEVLRRTGLEVERVTATEDRPLLEAASLELYAGRRRQRVPLLPASLRVTHVTADSPAAALGLEPGDVLIAAAMPTMFGRWTFSPLRSIEEFAAAARNRAGRDLQVLLLRDREGLEGTLRVATM